MYHLVQILGKIGLFLNEKLVIYYSFIIGNSKKLIRKIFGNDRLLKESGTGTVLNDERQNL